MKQENFIPDMADIGEPLLPKDFFPQRKIDGYPVRCISSNIRMQDTIAWEEYKAVPGVGNEGDFVLGRVKKVDARKEMEVFRDDTMAELSLHEGDYVVGILANRHSGTSEYAELPKQGVFIENGKPIDLVSSGGVMAYSLGIPKSLGNGPTEIEMVGLLSKGDKPANIMDFLPPWETEMNPSASIILSLGTSAEIGKTTTARKIIEGLRAKDKKVSTVKISGTGRKRDIFILGLSTDVPAYDFVDVGLPTTYTSLDRYVPAIYTLFNKINRESPDVIVAEGGGDIIEGNLPFVLQDRNIMQYVKGIVHSSSDALSIIGSLEVYKQLGVDVPIYLTYPYTKNFYAIEKRLREQGIQTPMFDPMNKDDVVNVIDKII